MSEWDVEKLVKAGIDPTLQNYFYWINDPEGCNECPFRKVCPIGIGRERRLRLQERTEQKYKVHIIVRCPVVVLGEVKKDDLSH